jgi:hypothetical protein
VTELVFILADFSAPSVGEHADTKLLPRLPALETLLARAQRQPLASDWRAWLAGHVHAEGATPAATVARAWVGAELGGRDPAGTGAAQHHWLATPVHFFAGIDRIQLHPAGLLQLTAAEQRALAQEFSRTFAGSPWELSAIGQRELLLAGAPLYATGLDPAGFAGDDPSAGLPRGPDAAALKRLGSEIELWLHQQPLNLAREQRGELTVSALWLWGGPGAPAAAPAAAGAARGPSPVLSPTSVPAPASAPTMRLLGHDTYAEALWRLRGAAAEALPDSFAAAKGLLDGGDSVVLYPMRHDGGITAALSQLEQRWLAGSVAALRRRRAHALWLLAGAHVWHLRWADLGRLWRRRSPWWEVLT